MKEGIELERKDRKYIESEQNEMDMIGKNRDVVKKLIEKKITITTMESCTGGFLISSITDIEGSSNITEGGFVTYSNKQKVAEGVPEDIIKTYGVYSKETASKMAEACREKMKCDIGIGITGTLSNIDTNNKDSIQGEVYFCIDFMGKMKVDRKIRVPIESRHEQKKFIVHNVLEELSKII